MSAQPNQSESWSDNAATRALAIEIVVLRMALGAMIETSRRREVLLEHYKQMLEGFAAEVLRR